MTKFKTMFVATAVSLVALVGIAAAKNGGHHAGGRAGMMQKYDANGDGKLDDAERDRAKAAFQQRRAEKQAKRLAQFDANRNGALDPAEKQTMHEQRVAKRFAKLDANKDGQLSLAELKAGKHKGKRGRP